MKAIYLVLLLAFAGGPFARAQDCDPALTQKGVLIEVCRQAGFSVISVAVEDFAVRAEVDPALNPRMFRRLSPVGKPRALRAEDQLRLRTILAEETSLPPAALAVVRFLGEFARPGYVPKEVDLTREARRTRPSPSATTTILCHRLGRPQKGYFSARGAWWEQTAVVGSNDCLGKCGPGCAPDGRWDRGTYTQECFNHDLCCRYTGDNLGDCEDEFWAAAAGFLSAPHCMFPEKGANAILRKGT